jgi:autoinducer 2-degrading protein
MRAHRHADVPSTEKNGHELTLAVITKVTIKPHLLDRFSKYVKADAEESLRHESECLRFDILADVSNDNVFVIYEVYRDADAYELHKEAPYYEEFFAEAGDTLACPPEVFAARTKFPRDDEHWAKSVTVRPRPSRGA